MTKNFFRVNLRIIVSKISKLNFSQKSYLFAIYMFIVFLFLFLFNIQKYMQAAIVFTYISICIGLANDFLSVYQKLWKTFIGKGFILLSYAMLTNFAYAFSSKVVNLITNIEATSLVYTTNFVAIFSIPIMIVFAIVILGIFVSIFGIFYIVFTLMYASYKNKKTDNIEKYPVITAIGRALAIMIIGGALMHLSTKLDKPYFNFIEEKTKWFIYNFEAMKNSSCKHKPDERIIRLNRFEMLTIKKESSKYEFTHKECIPSFK